MFDQVNFLLLFVPFKMQNKNLKNVKVFYDINKRIINKYARNKENFKYFIKRTYFQIVYLQENFGHLYF